MKQEVKEEVDDEVLNPLDMEMDDEDLLVSQPKERAKTSSPNRQKELPKNPSPLPTSTYLHLHRSTPPNATASSTMQFSGYGRVERNLRRYQIPSRRTGSSLPSSRRKCGCCCFRGW